MNLLFAVWVKLLAALAAWGAVVAFRTSRRVGNGLLPRQASYGSVAVDSLYYPAGWGAAVATLALIVTSDGWRSFKLAAILGGGLFAVLWPLYFATRAFFAKLAFDAMNCHRAFADERGLSFELVGPQSFAAVRWGDGSWLALVAVTSGSVGKRGSAQKTRLEVPIRTPVAEPEVWNLKPIDGLLGRALSAHAAELARLGARVNYIRLEADRLVLMGAPNRRLEQVSALVDFAGVLVASIDAAGTPDASGDAPASA